MGLTMTAILENFTAKCRDRKCKGDMQPDGTVFTLRLTTPAGWKLLVTRDEAVSMSAAQGWTLEDRTHG